MNQVVTIMMALIKSVICDEPVDNKLIEQITPEVRKELYSLSKKHDLAHLVAYALKKENALGDDEISELFSRSIYVAVARYTKIVTEQEKICNLLEQHQIMYVPLKGAVIRDYYPEPWMRTSCDIDILVREEDLEEAERILVKTLAYERASQDYHDISLYSPSGVHLELHFSIMENDNKIDGMLGRVWEYVDPIESNSCQYAMRPVFFAFHQMAHAMYHFEHGGCGIRPFIDIWLLNNGEKYDKEELRELYNCCRMEKFSEGVTKLIGVWFENKEHTELTNSMEQFICVGGVYGSAKNNILIARERHKYSKGYLMTRIFAPRKVLEEKYPILNKRRVLYLYYLARRWLKFFDSTVRRKAIEEIKINQRIKQNDVKEMKKMFQRLDL